MAVDGLPKGGMEYNFNGENEKLGPWIVAFSTLVPALLPFIGSQHKDMEKTVYFFIYTYYSLISALGYILHCWISSILILVK